MAMVAALKHQPGRLPDLQRQLRRDQSVGTAANAVGAEIFAAHVSPSGFQEFSSPPGENPRAPVYHGVQAL